MGTVMRSVGRSLLGAFYRSPLGVRTSDATSRLNLLIGVKPGINCDNKLRENGTVLVCARLSRVTCDPAGRYATLWHGTDATSIVDWTTTDGYGDIDSSQADGLLIVLYATDENDDIVSVDSLAGSKADVHPVYFGSELETEPMEMLTVPFEELAREDESLCMAIEKFRVYLDRQGWPDVSPRSWSEFHDPAGEIATNPAYDKDANEKRPTHKTYSLRIGLAETRLGELWLLKEFDADGNWTGERLAPDDVTIGDGYVGVVVAVDYWPKEWTYHICSTEVDVTQLEEDRYFPKSPLTIAIYSSAVFHGAMLWVYVQYPDDTDNFVRWLDWDSYAAGVRTGYDHLYYDIRPLSPKRLRGLMLCHAVLGLDPYYVYQYEKEDPGTWADATGTTNTMRLFFGYDTEGGEDVGIYLYKNAARKWDIGPLEREYNGTILTFLPLEDGVLPGRSYSFGREIVFYADWKVDPTSLTEDATIVTINPTVDDSYLDSLFSPISRPDGLGEFRIRLGQFQDWNVQHVEFTETLDYMPMAYASGPHGGASTSVDVPYGSISLDNDYSAVRVGMFETIEQFVDAAAPGASMSESQESVGALISAELDRIVSDEYSDFLSARSKFCDKFQSFWKSVGSDMPHLVDRGITTIRKSVRKFPGIAGYSISEVVSDWSPNYAELPRMPFLSDERAVMLGRYSFFPEHISGKDGRFTRYHGSGAEWLDATSGQITYEYRSPVEVSNATELREGMKVTLDDSLIDVAVELKHHGRVGAVLADETVERSISFQEIGLDIETMLDRYTPGTAVASFGLAIYAYKLYDSDRPDWPKLEFAYTPQLAAHFMLLTRPGVIPQYSTPGEIIGTVRGEVTLEVSWSHFMIECQRMNELTNQARPGLQNSYPGYVAVQWQFSRNSGATWKNIAAGAGRFEHEFEAQRASLQFTAESGDNGVMFRAVVKSATSTEIGPVTTLVIS